MKDLKYIITKMIKRFTFEEVLRILKDLSLPRITISKRSNCLRALRVLERSKYSEWINLQRD